MTVSTGTAVAAPDPLAPVRAALLARARSEAADLVGQADEEAAAEVGTAQARAQVLLETARVQGEADADAVTRATLSQAHREARALRMRAQRLAYDELRATVASRVTALREDPAYPAFREGLAARARAALGPDVVVTEDPSGGVLAEVEGRRVSYSLVALAERVLDEMAHEVEGLWAP